MKYLTALVLAATCVSATAAYVSISDGDLATNYTGASPIMSELDSAAYDLSDTTGLAAGEPIKVTLTLLDSSSTPIGDGTLWQGGFYGSGSDPVTANFRSTITLETGSFSDSVTDTENFGPFAASVFDSAVGYSSLIGATSLSIVVPWGTDLSNVAVSLTDESFFAGFGAGFADSIMTIGDAILSTATAPVPEPSTALFALLSAVSFLARSRRI